MLYAQPACRERGGCWSLPTFYSAQNPNPSNGPAHILDMSLLLTYSNPEASTQVCIEVRLLGDARSCPVGSQY